jgi:hypothetical protein
VSAKIRFKLSRLIAATLAPTATSSSFARALSTNLKKELGEGAIALAKNLNISGNVKTGVSDERLSLALPSAGVFS